MTKPITRNRASFEYAAALVTVKTVDGPPITLDEQLVEIAVTRGQPTDEDWQTAEWVGEPDSSRWARLTPFTPEGTGRWIVWVRVTDEPEIPVTKAGTYHIT